MNNLAEATRGERPDRRFLLLIVDGDEAIGGELAGQLTGYRVDGQHFRRPAEALLVAGALRPSAAVVAAGLPTMDSTELVRVLAGWAGIPTVVGIGEGDGTNAVAALRAGAAACVRRPYRVAEVVSILRAIRPGTAGPLDPAIELGDLRVDPATFEVSLRGIAIPLPMKEFKLLYFLVAHADRAVTREQLLAAAWHDTSIDASNTLTVHIKRLRRRLSLYGGQPPLIVTVRGLGYRLVPPAAMAPADRA